MNRFSRITLRQTTGSRLALVALAIAACCHAAPPVAALIDDDDPGYEDGGSGNTGSFPPAYVKPVNGFDWRAANRYNQWTSAWAERGQIRWWPSETYNPEYVNPSSWNLYMQGCQEEADFRYDIDPANYPKPARRYRWSWNGKTTAFSEDCSTTLDFPAQGNYYVELTVREPNGVEKSWTHPVQVKDFLIVVLGDSSASGEGAPDTPVSPILEDSRADWVDDRCHRSSYSGGAQAAKLLEQADPKSSVTFLSFACSGASLDTMFYSDNVEVGTGITGPYVGIEPTLDSTGNFANMLPAQTEQLNRALSGGNVGTPQRQVDALIVAGGINDVRFADLVVDCILFPTCYAWISGLPPTSVDARFYSDLQNVAPGWDKLGQQLDSYGIEVRDGKKLALEYPGFFHDDEGDMCFILFNDVLDLVIGSGWTIDEIAWADAYWAPDLNAAVRTGAERNDFTFVSGINNDFFGHGMCADDRYINTATDSANRQGDDEGEASFFAELFSKGTAHPNGKGYEVYAKRILNHLGDLLDNEPPVGVADKMWASPPLPSFMNVLDNDYDPDANSTLTARLVDKPKHGKATVSSDGSCAYKPKPGYSGPDRFVYGVSDGVYERFVEVKVTVEPLVVVQATVEIGATGTIGGMLGGTIMEGPYRVEFDRELPFDRGEARPIPGEAGVFFRAPERRRSIRIPYTVYSETTDRNSPDFGRWQRGLLKVKVVRPPRIR